MIIAGAGHGLSESSYKELANFSGDGVTLWLRSARFLRAGLRILLYVPFVVSEFFWG